MRNVSKGMEIWYFGQDAKGTFITIPDLIKGLGDPTACFLPSDFPPALILHPE